MDRDQLIRDLRLRFGADLPVTDKLPQPQQLAEKRSRIDLLGAAVGYQRGMFKTWDGAIVGLFVIPATVAGYAAFWQPIAMTGAEFLTPYVSAVANGRLPLATSLIMFGDPDQLADENGVIASLAPTVQVQPPPTALYGLISMMVWRITPAQSKPLASSTHRPLPTRWNSGQVLGRMTYVAGSPLSAIEEVSHYATRAGFSFPSNYHMHKILISGTMQHAENIPDERSERIAETQAIGDAWLRDAHHPILSYRSTFAKDDRMNFVLNLDHPGLEARVLESFPIEGMDELLKRQLTS